MRILVVPSWYPTQANEVAGIFIREQADALSAMHEVRVLFLDILPRGYRRKPKKSLTRARGYVEEICEVPAQPFVWRFTYLWYLLRALRVMRHEFRPDVIHAHIALPAGWASVIAGRLVRTPVVITENSSTFAPWLARRTWRWMASYAYRHADMVVAVSEGLRRRIHVTFGASVRTKVIPNIVDTSQFGVVAPPTASAGYRLLFVGLMDTDQKGVPVLLDAVRLAKEAGAPPFHLDVIGDGILRPEYERLAAEYGLGDTVTFQGRQDHAVIAGALAKSHALVQASLHEALPLVIIEALAAGRPVISTRCGGPEYMIDSSNGRIVEPGDAQGLAEAIADVLGNLSRYDYASIAASANAKYSYEAVTSALTRLYERLMEQRKRKK